MNTLRSVQDQSVVVDGQHRKQATEVHALLQGHPERLTVVDEDRPAQLPAEIASILAKVVEILAHGGNVTIGSLPEELTTTVAARQIGVSRPTLMKMIKDKALPSHQVGSHTRIASERCSSVPARTTR